MMGFVVLESFCLFDNQMYWITKNDILSEEMF